MANRPDEFIEYADENLDTLVKMFESKVKENPRADFLAVRDNSKEGRPYVWRTRQEVWDRSNSLSRGMQSLGLISNQTFDGQAWKFVGVMAKNCAVWLETMLACMYNSVTIPAFYDTLGLEGCRFILEQTQLTTIAL